MLPSAFNEEYSRAWYVAGGVWRERCLRAVGDTAAEFAFGGTDPRHFLAVSGGGDVAGGISAKPALLEAESLLFDMTREQVIWRGKLLLRI